MKKNKADSWLIKSSGRILGPFDFKAVVEMLKSRQLVVLDEVSAPESHWVYLRDRFEFAKVVEEIRNRPDRRAENTKTAATPTDAITGSDLFTVSVTEEIKNPVNDDLTPVNSARPVKSINNLVSVLQPKKDTASYGMANDANIERQVAKSANNWKWIFITLSLVMVAVVATQFVKTNQKKSGGGNADQLELGMQARQKGDARGAFEHFERAVQTENASDDAKILSSLYGLQFQSETFQIRSRLQTLSPAAQQSKEKFLLWALAHINDEQYAEASQQLQQGLRAPTKVQGLQDNAQIVVNQAIVEHLRNKHDEAIKLLTPYMKRSNNYLAMAVYSMSALSVAGKSGMTDQLKSASLVINEYLARQLNWGFELAILQTLILQRSNPDKAADFFQKEVLSRDPQMTELHWQDPWVAATPIRTLIYSDWCRQAVAANQLSAASKTIESFCHLRMARPLMAQKSADEAINLGPRDPLVNSWYAFVYKNTGNETMANEHIKKAELENEKLGPQMYSLPLVLKARWLADVQDYKSASDTWVRVSSINDKNVSALVGRAQYLFANGNVEQAKKMADKARSISEEFLPLIKLSYDLKKKESEQ